MNLGYQLLVVKFLVWNINQLKDDYLFYKNKIYLFLKNIVFKFIKKPYWLEKK